MKDKTSTKNYSGSKSAVRWKRVKEFPAYQVSTAGEVRRIDTGRIRKKRMSGGYYAVELKNNKKINKVRPIHILVAEAFIPNPEKLPKVDHKDNKRLNNNVKNLRWFTSQNNSLSYHRNFRTYRTILQCEMDGTIIREWKNTAEIIETIPNYNRKTINNNIRGASKSAYGSIWKYKDYKPKKEIKLKKNEIFKNIGVFEGNDLSNYNVSDYGNIKNNRNMVMSPNKNEEGYMVIHLTSKSKIYKSYRMHRLVAHVFISNKIEKNDKVNHIDEIRSNNYYKNLEWITQRNNVIHSLGKPVKMINPKTKKIEMIFRCIADASKYFELKNRCSNICKCCKNKLKSAHGYKWKYFDENETVKGLSEKYPVYKCD